MDVNKVLDACSVLFEFCRNFELCDDCPLKQICNEEIGADLSSIVIDIMCRLTD